ncbi:MAG: hypothetical protein HYV03_07410 [Deltaproteobacteria bacterium]|nr:hypothetical protein [Deltaproteobacteria bacterium]
MAKSNLQVRIPHETDAQIASLAPKSKSEFVRQAIREKLQRETFRRLETKWIAALKQHPEENTEAETWHAAEAWEER